VGVLVKNDDYESQLRGRVAVVVFEYQVKEKIDQAGCGNSRIYFFFQELKFAYNVAIDVKHPPGYTIIHRFVAPKERKNRSPSIDATTLSSLLGGVQTVCFPCVAITRTTDRTHDRPSPNPLACALTVVVCLENVQNLHMLIRKLCFGVQPFCGLCRLG
jgi:hypothetical protein